MDRDELAKMGIVFDEANNVISISNEDGEQIRIQLPEGTDPEEALQELVEQMGITSMDTEELCGHIHEMIDAVDDALIDMIENEDQESTQVVVNTLGAATSRIVAFAFSVCEDEQEEGYVTKEISSPLTQICTNLLMHQTGSRTATHEDFINIASEWLPIRAAVEGILAEVEA